MFKRIYNYRELLKTSIKKDIRGKYKGSFLGVLWAFLNPLMMLAVYSFVFPYILRVQQDNYVMFIFVALVPWTFFTTSLTRGSSIILANANIVKKIYFPREILPISVVTSEVVNFVISLTIIFAALIISGLGFSWYLLFLPVIMLIQYIIILGFVFIISAITPFLRDLEHIINVILLMLFYATPVIYPMSLIPEKYQTILNLNPMTHIIGGYRDIIYYQTYPNIVSLGKLFVVGMILLVVGYNIFNKLQKKFAEEL